jgi:hypothetical protein
MENSGYEIIMDSLSTHVAALDGNGFIQFYRWMHAL